MNKHITNTHTHTHSHTHSLTHLLTHSLTHLLTHSLTHSLTHLLTHSLTNSLTHHNIRVTFCFINKYYILVQAMDKTMKADISKDKFLVDGFPRNEDNLKVKRILNISLLLRRTTLLNPRLLCLEPRFLIPASYASLTTPTGLA